MKFHFRSFLRPALLVAVLALGTAAARADDNESEGSTARAKFSDPSKPGTLRLMLPWSEAHITGTDGNEIVVTSSLEEKGRRREVDAEGFRRLDDDLTFELTEANNVATITIAGDNAFAGHGSEFEIQVPRNTNLVLRTEMGGDIVIEKIDGDIDVNSMNGEVTLRDITSSAVVNTMNGEIHAEFARAPQKPVSLSSMNGEINLSLPGDTKASVRMRTHNGSIRTNFPEGALQTKTEKNPTPVAAAGGVEGAMASAQRELAREQARLDREQARAQHELDRAERAALRAATAPTPPAAPAAPDLVGVPTPMPAPVAMPMIPALPNFGGKSITGTLNGGGVDIKLTSMNGTITLRASK